MLVSYLAMKALPTVLLLCCIPLAAALECTPAGNERGVTTAISAGTLGLGAEAGYEFNKHWRVRLRGAYAGYNTDRGMTDFKVDIKYKGSNASLLLDYHPFATGLRLTAGLTANQATLRAGGNINNDCNGGLYAFGGDYYQATGPVDIRARYEWNSLQPHLALGWCSGSTGSKRLYWGCELGLTYMGKGKLKVSHSGQLHKGDPATYSLCPATDADLAASLRREAHSFFKMADRLQIYPVLQVAIGLRF